MALDNVRLGTTFTADASFYNDDGTPFSPKSPASYIIKDFNGSLISSGLGAQDQLYPERWHATITLPETAPYSNSQKYSIKWTLLGGKSGNDTNSYTEYFIAQPPSGVFKPNELDVIETELVIAQGDDLSDNLVLPPEQSISAYSIRIVDTDGLEYYNGSVSNAEPLDINGTNVYACEIDGSSLDSLVVNYRPYIVQWSYQLNGRLKKEYHFLYVVTYRVIYLMDQLNNFINKARFDHPNRHLRYNEVDLCNYLVQGVQIVNYTGPVFSSYTLANYPKELDFFLINAAAYVALSAQYLAEGVSAFEFSGQSVSLSVDRTQSIDGALSRVIDVLQNQLPKTKTLIAKSSTSGVLSLTLSPSSNPQFFYGYNDFDIGITGGINQRTAYYQNLISFADSSL